MKKLMLILVVLLMTSCLFAKEYSSILTKIVESNENNVYPIKWADENNCDSYTVSMEEIYYKNGKFIESEPSFVEEVKESKIEISVDKLTPGGEYYLRVKGKKGDKEIDVYEKHIILVSHVNIKIPKSLLYTLKGQEKDFFDKVNFNQVMFSTPSSEYNRDIALMSSVASACAYFDDFNNLKGCIEGFYNNLGFKDKEYYNEEELITKKEDSDKVLFAIGNRKINIKDKTYNIIFVAIRGTVAGEWFSNFNIGNEKYHKGFKIAADDVENKLEEYLKKYNLENSDTNIICLAGHSRGASIANILSASLLNKPYITKDKLFVYGYATTNVTKEIDVETNCFNFVNKGDFVPIIPYWEEWKRYGTDITTDVLSEEAKKNIINTFDGITGFNYADYNGKQLSIITKELFAVSPTVEDFYTKKYNISAKDGGKTTYEVCNIVGAIAATGKVKDLNKIPNEFKRLFAMLAVSNMGSPKVMNAHSMEFYINFVKEYNKTLEDKTYDFYIKK